MGQSVEKNQVLNLQIRSGQAFLRLLSPWLIFSIHRWLAVLGVFFTGTHGALRVAVKRHMHRSSVDSFFEILCRGATLLAISRAVGEKSTDLPATFERAC
jgi:hypothetical protein